jgi:hypothetical protein
MCNFQPIYIEVTKTKKRLSYKAFLEFLFVIMYKNFARFYIYVYNIKNTDIFGDLQSNNKNIFKNLSRPVLYKDGLAYICCLSGIFDYPCVADRAPMLQMYINM